MRTILDDLFDRSDSDRDDGAITCKRCGCEGLEWIDTGVRWRLWDGAADKWHVCANPKPENVFTNV